MPTIDDRDRLFREFQIRKFNRKWAVPTVSMTVDIDISRLQEIRKTFNEARQSENMSLTHVLIKAAGVVLENFPIMYSAFDGKRVVHSEKIKINLPVAEGDHVEYVMIETPQLKTVEQIAREVGEEMERIRRGEGTFYQYLKGVMKVPLLIRKLTLGIPALRIKSLNKHYGNFPITNFGSFGIKNGIPAVSSPVVGVMCIGTVWNLQVATDDRKSVLASFLPITIAFDHRPIDGAYGGRFLSAFKELLEKNPESLFQR